MSGRTSQFGLMVPTSLWSAVVPTRPGWYAVVHVLDESAYPSAAVLRGGKWDCDEFSLRAFHGPHNDRLSALKWAYEHEPTLVEIELLTN